MHDKYDRLVEKVGSLNLPPHTNPNLNPNRNPDPNSGGILSTKPHNMFTDLSELSLALNILKCYQNKIVK